MGMSRTVDSRSPAFVEHYIECDVVFGVLKNHGAGQRRQRAL
jgi:hypothetical protein